jgi:hypothetical protein
MHGNTLIGPSRIDLRHKDIASTFRLFKDNTDASLNQMLLQRHRHIYEVRAVSIDLVTAFLHPSSLLNA